MQKRLEIGIVVGIMVVLLGIAGEGIVRLFSPRSEGPLILPAEPEPAAADALPPEFPARALARGDLDFPFLAYEAFGPGRLALAAPAAGGAVAVLVAEYKDGALSAVSRIDEPMGAVRDVTQGDLLNKGTTQAVVTTEKGMLILLDTMKYLRHDEPGLERVFVGDWDGDGRSEAAYLNQEKGTRQVTVMTYTSDGKGKKVGVFPAPDFPVWSAVLHRYGEPSRLMGAEIREGGAVQVIFYRLDPATGLQAVARYPLRPRGDEQVVSFAAGDVAGRPTLAISFRGSQSSYVELFDTAGEGMPSRGRILLPEKEPYGVVLGPFTGPVRTELLAISPAGVWLLFELN